MAEGPMELNLGPTMTNENVNRTEKINLARQQRGLPMLSLEEVLALPQNVSSIGEVINQAQEGANQNTLDSFRTLQRNPNSYISSGNSSPYVSQQTQQSPYVSPNALEGIQKLLTNSQPQQQQQPIALPSPDGGQPAAIGNVKLAPDVGGGKPLPAKTVQASTGGGLEQLYEQQGGDVNKLFSGLIPLDGEGDGMSDNIAMPVVKEREDDPDVAMVSPHEFVVDAHSVAALGNGSSEAGAKLLDQFILNIRKGVYNKGKQPSQVKGIKIELANEKE